MPEYRTYIPFAFIIKNISKNSAKEIKGIKLLIVETGKECLKRNKLIPKIMNNWLQNNKPNQRYRFSLKISAKCTSEKNFS